MGHPLSKWKYSKNKRMKGRTYVGGYEWVHVKKAGAVERVFVLSAVLRTGRTHRVTFESHNAASALGWKKIK